MFETSSIYKAFCSENERLFRTAVEATQNFRGGPQNQTQDMASKIAQFEVKCPKCNKRHKVGVKFTKNEAINNESIIQEGLRPFPKDCNLNCDCGGVINLMPFKTGLETNTGMQIVAD